MKKYLNLATALIASFRPKSKIPIIDSYGQSTLNQDEQQALMEWLFASLMGAGYLGKAHLIGDDGHDREREIFTALMRNEPIFLYRQGARPSPTVEGYCWRLIGEHPSLRVYQLYQFHKIVLQLVGMVFVSQFLKIRKKNVRSCSD